MQTVHSLTHRQVFEDASADAFLPEGRFFMIFTQWSAASAARASAGRRTCWGWLSRADRRRICRIRRRKRAVAGRLARRRHVADFQRQKPPRRAGAEDAVQRAVRHPLVFVRVLRRNDCLPGHDRADGRRAGRLAASPVQRRAGARQSAHQRARAPGLRWPTPPTTWC